MDLAALFENLPDDRAELWSRLAAMAGAWFGPLTEDDGVPEDVLCQAEARLGLTLPAALREAYGRFGRKEELTRGFEVLFDPSELCVDGDLLVFWAKERDRNAPPDAPEPYRWGIRLDDLGNDDPPVFVIVRRTKPAQRAVHPGLPPVSRFFASMALMVTEQAAPYGATIDEDVEQALAEAARRFTPLGFPDVEYPPPHARLFGGDDVLVVTTRDEVYVAAPNPAGFARAIEAFAGVRWNAPSVDDAYRGPYREARAGLDWVAGLLRSAAKSGMPPPGKGPS